jgi:hypothetical protein
VGETGINIAIGIVIVLFLLLSVFRRKRRSDISPLERVFDIALELDRNEERIENPSPNRGISKLKTSAWERHRNNLDCLSEELRMTLSQVFEMSEEINERIDAAKKFKSDSYLAGIDVSKLRAPLASCRQQLRKWLEANIDNPDYKQRLRRGLFG